MLVIHPKDRTTVALSTLYKEQEHIIIDYDCGSNQLAHVLHHVPMGERIMLLGHGSDKGLYYRKNDMEEGFDRIIVGHPHAGATLSEYGVTLWSLQNQKDCMDCFLL